MKPLYEKIRPNSLEKIVGQDHLIGQNGKLSLILKSKNPASILLYGPPGSGKTTLARLYAKSFNLPFFSVTGVLQSAGEIKKILLEASATPLFHQKTVLFVDEIHRLNKAQQDLFLPFLEDGALILVGATTENPSFSLQSALLSRLHTFTLKPLNTKDLLELVEQCEGVLGSLELTNEIKEEICKLALGDGRYLINLVEMAASIPKEERNLDAVHKYLTKRASFYDKDGEQHYNLISALHKAVRGSDVDAALYWLARMLDGGEDPLFITRRVIRMASEDIGLADPQALPIAIGAHKAYEMLGSPEGELAIAQAIIYLSLCPKSNAVYSAFSKAKEDASKTSHFKPPSQILNAPTAWMKEEGRALGYVYDHDCPNGCSGASFFPLEMQRATYYQPVERGFERDLSKRIQYFMTIRNKKG